MNVKPKVRGRTVAREVFTGNEKITRMSFFIERTLDMKITVLARKKRILKSELFNQLLKLGLEKDKQKGEENAVNE
jgi:hypothetical protein